MASLVRDKPFTSRGKDAFKLKQSEGLLEGLASYKSEVSGTRISFFDWAMRVPEPKTGRLNFDAFPFQRELYEEGVDEKAMVVKKSTQVGISAWGIRWSLYHADTRGFTGLYVFPTKADMWDYATLRVDPLLESAHLRTRRAAGDPDNKGMKGLGLGVVVFRGSESKRGLDSVDCDHILFDEYDTLDHTNIPDAEMRVSSPLSPGLIRRVGVPSTPDWGIDLAYTESDQRVWLIKCGSCGEWQDLDFWRNVDMKTGVRICASCGRSVEDDIAKGEWVARYPERDVRGYHVTRLMAPGAKIADSIKASKNKKPSEVTVFHNKHLGLAYESGDSRLSKEQIQAAQTFAGGYTMNGAGNGGQNLVTAGIDVASARDLNVRISEHLPDGRKRALYIGTAQRFLNHEAGEGVSLEALMQRYGVMMAAIDHLPEGRLARAFAERFAGLVYLVAYDTVAAPKNPDVLKVNEEMRFATVRRTIAIDATLEGIRSLRNLLPMDLPEGYVEHLQALNRVVEEDSAGRKLVSYVSRGADDYAHAEVYDTVAADLWLYRQAADPDESYGQLDDVLDFQRSQLANYSTDPEGYVEGPDADIDIGQEEPHYYG